MGVLDPHTPNNDETAAPKRGFFVRRINNLKEKCRKHSCPAVPGEAMWRGNIVKYDFHASVANFSSCAFQQSRSFDGAFIFDMKIDVLVFLKGEKIKSFF